MWLNDQPLDFFTTSFRNVDIPMLISGTKGEIYWVNKAFEDFIGYNSWELTKGSDGKGISWEKLSVNDENLEADKAMLKEAIEGNVSSYSVKKQYIPKNEKSVWVDLHVVRYPLVGPIKYFLVTVLPLKNGTAAAFNLAMTTIKELTEKMSKVPTMEQNIIEGVSKKMESRTDMENIFLSTGKLVQKYPKVSAAIFLTMLMMLLGNQLAEAIKNTKSLLGW